MDFEKYSISYNVFYRVYVGSHTTYYYTSCQTPISWGENTYVPATIEKDSISKQSILEQQGIILKCPVDEIFAATISSTFPDLVIVEIFILPSEIDEYTSEYPVYKGLIRSVKMSSKLIAEISISDESLSKKYPQFIIQPGCNHALYDENCSLNREDFEESIYITEIVEPHMLYSLDLAGFEASYFKYGKAYYLGEWRAIVDSSSVAISLNHAFTNDVTEETITIYPGCDKKSSTCKNKFNNFNHFLGFTVVPKKNPIISGIGVIPS